MYEYINKSEEFASEGVALLPMQFYNKENITKLSQIACSRLQDMHNRIVDVATKRLLENATGEQLDEIGRQMNIYRLQEQTDEQYRSMIYMFIYAQISESTRDEIVALLKLFTGGQAVWLYRGFGTVVDVIIYSWCVGTQDFADVIAGLFPINTDLRICTHGRGHYFGFEGGGEFVKGFGTTDEEQGYELSGGGISSLIYSTT